MDAHDKMLKRMYGGAHTQTFYVCVRHKQSVVKILFSYNQYKNNHYMRIRRHCYFQLLQNEWNTPLANWMCRRQYFLQNQGYFFLTSEEHRDIHRGTDGTLENSSAVCYQWPEVVTGDCGRLSLPGYSNHGFAVMVFCVGNQNVDTFAQRLKACSNIPNL